MTVISRRVKATPARSASDAWKIIVNLLAPQTTSEAHQELVSVSGIATSLISDEAMKEAAIVVYGDGPRLRIRCLYGDDAVFGENANEGGLAFTPTEGDWIVSLPCPAEDLNWVQEALKKRSRRITARDLNTTLESEQSEGKEASAVIDMEAFLRS